MKLKKLKKLKIFVPLFLLVFLNSCACESTLKRYKHWKSSVIGLSRKVQLISCADGKVIREWEGRFKVEVDGGVASWISDGNERKISGCFVIEEN